ncbi:hypothetical protein DLAC_08687 [Tieghemostelium lacteum]|uniref:Uncharacterized protein n=1 Tax=Tieghemostelium lacteum TaxID=361077 RepID=A0A151Z821_TIELA|nr:hypothetical protein DLAC_08687 [Tieghemostelium lacteum]|eukprot:KYQ90102.1 hypothetical protein DLAC_08687 [Tieghemostelium lacteum]
MGNQFYKVNNQVIDIEYSKSTLSKFLIKKILNLYLGEIDYLISVETPQQHVTFDVIQRIITKFSLSNEWIEIIKELKWPVYIFGNNIRKACMQSNILLKKGFKIHRFLIPNSRIEFFPLFSPILSTVFETEDEVELKFLFKTMGTLGDGKIYNFNIGNMKKAIFYIKHFMKKYNESAHSLSLCNDSTLGNSNVGNNNIQELEEYTENSLRILSTIDFTPPIKFLKNHGFLETIELNLIDIDDTTMNCVLSLPNLKSLSLSIRNRTRSIITDSLINNQTITYLFITFFGNIVLDDITKLLNGNNNLDFLRLQTQHNTTNLYDQYEGQIFNTKLTMLLCSDRFIYAALISNWACQSALVQLEIQNLAQHRKWCENFHTNVSRIIISFDMDHFRVDITPNQFINITCLRIRADNHSLSEIFTQIKKQGRILESVELSIYDSNLVALKNAINMDIIRALDVKVGTQSSHLSFVPLISNLSNLEHITINTRGNVEESFLAYITVLLKLSYNPLKSFKCFLHNKKQVENSFRKVVNSSTIPFIKIHFSDCIIINNIKI